MKVREDVGTTNETRTFVLACLAGDLDLDDIDDYVDEWHAGGTGVTIWDFLGMTREEYGAWVADPESLPRILQCHRFDQPFDAHPALANRR